MESISSLEKTLEDQTKLHKKQINELLHEKNILQTDVQKCECEIKRTEALLLDLKSKEQNHLDLAASLDAQLKLKVHTKSFCFFLRSCFKLYKFKFFF